MYLIGVDIGGTNLKVGLIKDKKIIDKIVVPTNKDNVISQLEKIVSDLLASHSLTTQDIVRMGVGCPGIVVKGKVLNSVNLNFNNCDLQKILSKDLTIKTFVKNDADMAILGEYVLGAGKGAENVIMLTIGTGIGGGIILNGKLYEGNGAGEFGHVTLYKGGIKCNCGRLGCAEKYLSAIALSERAKQEIKKTKSTIELKPEVRASDIEKAYLDGDLCAKKIVDSYCEDLSAYLLNICNIFRPDRILIGGGLSYAPQIIKNVAQLCKNKYFGYPNAPQTDIKIAKLGNDAGILGVVAL